LFDALTAFAAQTVRTAGNPVFTVWGSPVSALEGAAFFAALAMVVANLRVHPVAWPLAIFSSVAYGLLFFNSRLYGEAALQLMFIALALWGWWQWLRGTAADGSALQVGRMHTRQRWQAVAATLLAWPLLGLLLARTTDSDVPYFDALPTVASITGQLLLARKKVENWPTWLAVNSISVVLFAYKDLWLTAVLYALFALLSLWGWHTWLRLAQPAGHRGHGA
jgi:nicotinamide mononucleotide transporter